MKDFSKASLVSFILLMLMTNKILAENYWGAGHIQPLNKNPNPVIDQQTRHKVVSLPDVPDVSRELDQMIQQNQNKPITETSSSHSPTLELGVKSEKIPIGKSIKLAINNNLDAKKSKQGDPFSASVKNDVIVNGNIILPAGSLIRGRIGKVKKPGIFSKSGSIILNFDHIVTPLGKQVTLDVDLSDSNKINKKGALVASEGLGSEIKQSAKDGLDTTVKITKAGYGAGMKAGKVPVVATAPAGAAIGALAGTTVFATKSAIAIFKKGGNPQIMSGETLEITFSEDLDIPVN